MEKEGLVTDRTYNELFWQQELVASNQIRDLKFLLGNNLLAVRAHTVGPALFAVTRDVFFCIPLEWLAVRMVTRPLFPLDWGVWRVRLGLI